MVFCLGSLPLGATECIGRSNGGCACAVPGCSLSAPDNMLSEMVLGRCILATLASCMFVWQSMPWCARLHHLCLGKLRPHKSLHYLAAQHPAIAGEIGSSLAPQTVCMYAISCAVSLPVLVQCCAAECQQGIATKACKHGAKLFLLSGATSSAIVSGCASMQGIKANPTDCLLPQALPWHVGWTPSKHTGSVR